MPETPDVREQLAAYLAGELDAADTAAIEARMASEPWVAEAADDMADMLVRLGRVDHVDPPAGYGDRLRQAVASEAGHPVAGPKAVDPAHVRASGAAAADGWSARPAGRADARRPGAGRSPQRRSRRDRLNRTVLGVAAAIAVLFVGSTAVLLGGGLTSSNDTADSGEAVESTLREFTGEAADSAAMDDEAAPVEAPVEESAPMAADAAAPAAEELTADDLASGEMADEPANDSAMSAEDSAATTAGPQGDGTAAAGSSGPAASSSDAGPETVLLGEIGDDATIRVELGERPAVARLLGRPAADGAELADPFRDEILRADPFPDGTPPGACLREVLRDADADVVAAVAGQFTQDGDARLGYALVRSSDGQTLDHVDVWIVDQDGCAVLAVLS